MQTAHGEGETTHGRPAHLAREMQDDNLDGDLRLGESGETTLRPRSIT